VLLIIALFIALISVLTILFQLQMQVLIGVRAYVGGEGMWAKAQKEAVHSLEHYALTNREQDYNAFLQIIQLPLGDLHARIELQKPDPNFDIARAGFLAGGNHPDDIQAMCYLFVRFQHMPFMSMAIEHWTKGDKLIAELRQVAENLHHDLTNNSVNAVTLEAYRDNIDSLNRQLADQENQFSATLANASRWASAITRDISYILAILFAIVGFGVSWTIISRIRAIENALLSSEATLRIAATAFESQESLIITDANGAILRVNRAFSKNTGYQSEEVLGQTPRILKSDRHPPEFYQGMWQTLLRNGFWQGEIWDKRKNGQVYPKWLSISAVKGLNDETTHYIGSYIDITERKEAEEKIKHLAFHDHLTNLPNRRLLIDRLQLAMTASARTGRKGALLFIDLDNFKDLNDTLGHDIGDLLLQEVARRLDSCFFENDTVSRMGGDEFVVMLQDLGDHDFDAAKKAEAIAIKALATLRHSYTLNHYSLSCTASIGITLFGGNDQFKDELMKQADIAMYQAKKAGRNTIRFFDNHMQDVINSRARLDNELHSALGNHQFQLYYQIQVDHQRDPIGAEALIRWRHPARGLVLPNEFIPLAEETGLIAPIGKWVLETACAQIKTWEQNESTKDLVLAVNVSANQFYEDGFVELVHDCIKRYDIVPMLLKLELTESLMLKDIDDTITTMHALKNLGVQLSLDDFGTGYSSLQYLKRLPFDQVKIDRSFVRDIATDPNDAAIVQTIIAMANTLGLSIIAEGVETEEQYEFLLSRGCLTYQGFLFGKPVPLDEFQTLLLSLQRFA
jgi:diguanylate cyclase (GGDEF)-like protein/PAS domain S-box-containing protein